MLYITTASEGPVRSRLMYESLSKPAVLLTISLYRYFAGARG